MATSVPDWTPLLHAAAIDPSQLVPTELDFVPPLPFDQRAEWTLHPAPGLRLQVNAASYRGRPVFFRIVGPWSDTATQSGLIVDFNGPVSNWESASIDVLCVVLGLGLPLAGAKFARRNIRMGRGDRTGAFQIFLFTASLSLLLWLCWGHILPDIESQYRALFRACGEGMVFGGFAWLSYLSLEPYVRSRWPHTLTSWAKISSGKLQDSVVARDVLVGILLGSLGANLAFLENLVTLSTDTYGILPLGSNPNCFGDLRHLLGVFAHLLQQTVFVIFVLVILIYVGKLIFRKDHLAVGFAFVVATAASLTPGNLYLDLPLTAIQIALFLFAVIRFGLVALFAAEFTLQLIAYGPPLTLRLNDWYFSRSLIQFLAMMMVAIWAFCLSTRGSRHRPVFSLEED